MSNKKTKILIIPIILLTIFMYTGFSVNPNHNSLKFPELSNPPMRNVIIDGVINEGEWSAADWEIDFFLDADNTPDWNNKINVDGNNTMYIGEDLDNLYIALDLSSDRSDNDTGEWVGLWLNTENRTFDNEPDWYEYFNNGTETLLHDVEKNLPWQYFTNEIWLDYVNITDNLEYDVTNGIIEGDYTDLYKPFDGNELNITSEAAGQNHTYWMDCSFDLASWFPWLEWYTPQDGLKDIDIVIMFKFNTTVNDHKIIMWDSDDTMPPLEVPNQVKQLSTNEFFYTEYTNYAITNLTNDNEIRFSLYANHSSPFKINIDEIKFNIPYNRTNFGESVYYPYSTIKNYQIDWSFGPSPNNATDHRMFEFCIPKSELEGYNANTELGIIVGGYGTLATYPNTNNWVYSETDIAIFPGESDKYKYYDMKGVAIPFPSVSTLTIVTPSPTTSLEINLTWTTSIGADNYTLYRHSSEISSGNLNSATEVTTISGTNSIDTVSGIGTWYYSVVANNEWGSSEPSNSPHIEVQATQSQPIPGFSPMYIVLISILMISIIIFRKSYKLRDYN